ncbi:MAG: hypothetical protein AABX71_03165 [Nanoarchaeota archaeon]
MSLENKNRHDADCTVYSALDNGRHEDGICTCGYGLQLLREGDASEMYSEERLEELVKGRGEKVK